jgi:HAD superfamily hydrolase (TIGR01490 family)
MDKTLISENSGALYMKYRYERGEISGVEVLKGIAAYLQYKLGILDMRNWTRDTMQQFKGQREQDLVEEAAEGFNELVAASLYLEAAGLVGEHLAAGHVVAIVSGATRFVVEPLAERLGVQHLLYTRLEVEDGLFTGRVDEPICYGEGKIYWLGQLVEEQDIDLARSWFYTDSITDKPLLDVVGHPVAVNPDPLLYREAVRRCWPVRMFTPPSQRQQPTALLS